MTTPYATPQPRRVPRWPRRDARPPQPGDAADPTPEPTEANRPSFLAHTRQDLAALVGQNQEYPVWQFVREKLIQSYYNGVRDGQRGVKPKPRRASAAPDLRRSEVGLTASPYDQN